MIFFIKNISLRTHQFQTLMKYKQITYFTTCGQWIPTVLIWNSIESFLVKYNDHYGFCCRQRIHVHTCTYTKVSNDLESWISTRCLPSLQNQNIFCYHSRYMYLCLKKRSSYFFLQLLYVQLYQDTVAFWGSLYPIHLTNKLTSTQIIHGFDIHPPTMISLNSSEAFTMYLTVLNDPNWNCPYILKHNPIQLLSFKSMAII